MDVLRRNTDYALRMMVNLAGRFNGEFTSARELAKDGNFSYQLGCKILQKLHKADLVKSDMGPKGGFALSREPSQISLMEIITALQGGIRLNRCLLGGRCEFESECEINTKLTCLQLYLNGYLNGISLQEILDSRTKITAGKKKS
jgi:Rrf2 family protein